VALDVIASGASALDLDLRRDEIALELARPALLVPAQHVEREAPVGVRRLHHARMERRGGLRASLVEVRSERPVCSVRRAARFRRRGVVRAALAEPVHRRLPWDARGLHASAERSADESGAADRGGEFWVEGCSH